MALMRLKTTASAASLSQAGPFSFLPLVVNYADDRLAPATRKTAQLRRPDAYRLRSTKTVQPALRYGGGNYLKLPGLRPTDCPN